MAAADPDQYSDFSKRWAKYRVDNASEDNASEDNAPEESPLTDFDKRWAKYRVKASDKAPYDPDEEPDDNYLKNTFRGLHKGLSRGLTSTIGSLARLGAAGLEEEPEDKYLTKFARTGKAPEISPGVPQENYNLANPTSEEHQKSLESLIAPDYFSKRAPGFGGTLENYLEKAVPNAAFTAAASGAAPWAITAGLFGDALRQAGLHKTALAAELLTPTNPGRAAKKVYGLAKAVMPKGKIIPIKAVLDPIEKAFHESKVIANPEAYSLIKSHLGGMKRAFLHGKSEIPKATIDESIKAAHDVNQSIGKVLKDKRFSKSEVDQINKILFNVSQDIKSAAYKAPGAEKFSVLNKAADHAYSTHHQNPGALKWLRSHFKNNDAYHLAYLLHFVPFARAGSKWAAAGAALTKEGKDIYRRISRDPLLRQHYLRAKSAAAVGAAKVVEEELKQLHDKLEARGEDEE